MQKQRKDGLTTERLSKGRTAEVFLWENNGVLKLFYQDQSHARIMQEAETTHAVREAGLRVPEVRGTVEIDGRQGIIMDRVGGCSMKKILRSKPWMIGKIARTLAELHANMHACMGPHLPSQRELLERRIDDAADVPASVKEAAREVLGKLPGGNTVCHGDFHIDNILFESSDSDAFILDWRNGSRGNPLVDVAQTLLLLRLNPVATNKFSWWTRRMAQKLLRRLYLKRYLKLRPSSRQQIAAFEFPVVVARLGHGIASEREQLLAVVERSLARVKDKL